MSESTIKNGESSRIYTLFYSFFLIPFMIAIFGATFFLLFKFITYETNDAAELLNQVKIGSASKRWQSAFELSKLLNNPDRIPNDASFKNQMVSVYKHSIHDDPLVRSYLALAMGTTRDNFYDKTILEGLNDTNLESRIAAIQAMGMIKSPIGTKKLLSIAINCKNIQEKLAATISLGLIGDEKAVPILIDLLEDEEPNIRWDAAIGLAKMGNKSGVYVIENLLDRSYLNEFPEIDEQEKTKALMVAIEVSSILKDKKFKSRLVSLAESDKNLKIRDAAIKTLQSTYNISI
tara:strand:+ start:100 stop:972 length:873 start_codon:yes stop_codon:yes gene_type:complete